MSQKKLTIAQLRRTAREFVNSILPAGKEKDAAKAGIKNLSREELEKIATGFERIKELMPKVLGKPL